MLMIDGNGNFTLHNGNRKQDDVKALAQQLLSQGIVHTIEFGPALVKDGEALPFTTKSDNDNKYVISTRSSQLESRTAIGQISPLHYVIIVADGTFTVCSSCHPGTDSVQRSLSSARLEGIVKFV